MGMARPDAVAGDKAADREASIRGRSLLVNYRGL